MGRVGHDLDDGADEDEDDADGDAGAAAESVLSINEKRIGRICELEGG